MEKPPSHVWAIVAKGRVGKHKNSVLPVGEHVCRKSWHTLDWVYRGAYLNTCARSCRVKSPVLRWCKTTQTGHQPRISLKMKSQLGLNVKIAFYSPHITLNFEGHIIFKARV